MREQAPFYAIVCLAIGFLAGMAIWWLFAHWTADLEDRFMKCNANPQCKEGFK